MLNFNFPAAAICKTSSSSVHVGIMVPKPKVAQAAPKPSAKQAKDAKSKPPGQEAALASSRGDISNMLTQLKSSSDPNKQQVLAMYKAQGRFSAEKAAILQKWKMDKSCKWAATYQQEKTTETVVKDTVLEGYGTRCGACTKSLGEHDALIMFVDYSLLGIAHSCFLSFNLHVPGLMWPRP